jgi:hypothetical protein
MPASRLGRKGEQVSDEVTVSLERWENGPIEIGLVRSPRVSTSTPSVRAADCVGNLLGSNGTFGER